MILLVIVEEGKTVALQTGQNSNNSAVINRGPERQPNNKSSRWTKSYFVVVTTFIYVATVLGLPLLLGFRSSV